MGNRGFFGFSTGFSSNLGETLFSELELWLAADTLVGYADGNTVATWPDNSGKGRDAVQASETLKPVYRPSVYSLPVLQFDNTNDAMTTTCSLTGTFSLFVVYASIQATSYNGRAVQGSVNYLIGPRGTYHQLYNGALIQGPSVSANVLVCSVHVQQTTGGTFWVNGNLINSNTNTGGVSTVGLGRAGANAEGLNGYLAEVMAYGWVLSNEERSVVQTYLMSKWGIS